jgi:hypothetical protein
MPIDFTKPGWKYVIPTNEAGRINPELQLFAKCMHYEPVTKLMRIECPGLSLQAPAVSLNTGLCCSKGVGKSESLILIITGQRFSGMFNKTIPIHLQDEVHIQFCNGPERPDEVWWLATVFVNGDKTAKQTYCNEA